MPGPVSRAACGPRSSNTRARRTHRASRCWMAGSAVSPFTLSSSGSVFSASGCRCCPCAGPSFKNRRGTCTCAMCALAPGGAHRVCNGARLSLHCASQTSRSALGHWSASVGAPQLLLLALTVGYLLRKLLPQSAAAAHLGVSCEGVLRRGRVHTLLTATLAPVGLVHWLHALVVLMVRA